MVKVKDWKNVLSIANKMSVENQNKNKNRILEAFKQMWDSNPSENVFAIYVNGLVLNAEMIYYMHRGGKHGQK